MVQHFLQLALLTLCACTIGANNAEVEEVCGNNASFLCTGDFTRPNPVQYEKTCRELINKENEERNANNILIKFLMINYNKAACEEYNERINNNKNLIKRLYCNHLTTTTTSCPHVTTESPLETTQTSCTKTTLEPFTETTTIPCTKIISGKCMKTTPHSNNPILYTTKKPRGNSKKRRKANKKRLKNMKEQEKGNEKPGKRTSRKPIRNKNKETNLEKVIGNHPGRVKKNPRKSKPVANHSPCQATKPPFKQ